MKEKSILKHFFIIGSGTIINMLIGLITTPIITRIINPSEYGRFSMFTLYVSIGTMIFCFGLDQALVRYFYKYESLNYKSEILYKCCILPIISSVIFSIIVVCLSYNKKNIFEFDSITMFLMCICIIIQIINRFSILLIRLNYKSKLFSILNIMQKLIYVVMVLLLFKIIDNIKFNFLILIFSVTCSYAIPTAYGIICQKNIWVISRKQKTNLVNKLEIIKYGAPYILSTGLTLLFQAIDKISLNKYCSYVEVGIYSSAMTLVNIFAIIQSTFNTLWAPMSIEHYEKYPEDKQFYQKMNQTITIVMFSIGIFLILFRDVFVILLGEKYREASYILPFLIFNPIMYTISETTVCGIVLKKKSNMNIWISLFSCITNIIGNMILVPKYQSKGAAISTGLAYIVFWASRTVLSNRYYYIDFKLRKIFLLIVVTGFNALYNTFFDFGIISIIIFLINGFFIVILYWSMIKYLYQVCISKFDYYIKIKFKK